MIATLSKFDKITAAGILARAALSIDHEENPAARYSIAEESELRKRIFWEAKTFLGVNPNDHSVDTMYRVAELLDHESDLLLGPMDEAKVLDELSDKGELPSDLFVIEIAQNIEELYGKRFFAEKKIIENTIRRPDREQHYGMPVDNTKPFLISLFAKFVPNKYPSRSFTMLVAGQRHGTVFVASQVWRLYEDSVDMLGAKDLVDLLRRFSDKFGTPLSIGDKRANFFLLEDIPPNNAIRTGIIMGEKRDKKGRPVKEEIMVCNFHQFERFGTTNQAALIVAIDLIRYRKCLLAHAW